VLNQKNTEVCKGCNKTGHCEKNCWTLHPKQRPKWYRQREEKNTESETENPDESNKKRRKTWPKLHQDDDSDDASMLLDFIAIPMNLFLDYDDGQFIFLDSGASRLLFLLKSKELLTDFRISRRAIGTANNTGVIQVTGVGKIADEEAELCLELRRSILSLGRVHAWGLTVKLPPDGQPVLLDTNDYVIMQGHYVLAMPCFTMDDIRAFLFSRAEVATNTVCVVTRSMEKTGEAKIEFLSDNSESVYRETEDPFVEETRLEASICNRASSTAAEVVVVTEMVMETESAGSDQSGVTTLRQCENAYFLDGKGKRKTTSFCTGVGDVVMASCARMARVQVVNPVVKVYLCTRSALLWSPRDQKKMFLDAEQRELDYIGSRLCSNGRGSIFYIPILLCTFTTFLYIDLDNSLYRLLLPRFGYRPECRFEVLKLLFLSLGCKPSMLDPCLFVYVVGKLYMLVYLYADDVYIVTNAGMEYRQPQISESTDRYRRKERLEVGLCNCWMCNDMSRLIEVGCLFYTTDSVHPGACLRGMHMVSDFSIGFAVKNIVDYLDMCEYSYAMWAGYTRTRNFTSGLIVYEYGRPLAWESKPLITVTAVDTESELVVNIWSKILVLKVWISLLSYIFGEVSKGSVEVIEKQERAKEAEFPSGVGKP